MQPSLEANIIFTEKKKVILKEQYNPLKPLDAWNLSKKPIFHTLAVLQFIEDYVINKDKSPTYQWKNMMPYIC